ncbi:ogr/Delta-like zinc finger family protein [Endozoicomonas sp. GU-1]|uniref:ogr/Delta-like zinc finger family protein n=1 Tax=Endozoicomonas sp. GU-1 TaxID=3009078 RepID=UPI0022B47D6B|nr:ogr/Delta-like zinc finger family protein [Endozoicomonas sp. GU-1]WBA86512.1 ogr/Delta-like zinc finger family protein [Endozoicomonas sp. GU-1]
MSVGFHAQQVSNMRVLCPHCQNKSVITASNRLSPSVAELYCRCNNEECQAGFVMTVAHKHDTQPPINNMKEMLAQLLRAMPSDERNQLMAQFPL